MRTSRREFLVAATALMAAGGCDLRGASDEIETVRPDEIAPEQMLDAELRLAVPGNSLAPISVHAFERRANVAVTTERVSRDIDLLRGLRAGATGSVDAVLVGSVVLAELVRREMVEPLEASLVRGRDALLPPFSDPAADPALRHSVPQDYTPVGIAALVGAPLEEPTWAGFFRLAGEFQGQVDVPDDPDLVLGAALAALGHDWNSNSDDQLQQAAELLEPLRGFLTVRPIPRRVAPSGALAALTPGARYRAAGRGVEFVIPEDGSVVLAQSWCIPIYAPHPVSANAWLAHAIDPVTAAGAVRATGLASPVDAARPLVGPRLLLDPAVYPPRGSMEQFTQPSGEPEAIAKRAAIWQELDL